MIVQTVPLPDNYYMSAHGDPVPMFDRGGNTLVLLELHDDGTVTWRRDGEQA